MDSAYDREFWKRHPGLVWSNRQADDGVRIRAALTRPRFEQLLDVSRHFGLERVRAEWSFLRGEPSPETLHAAPLVERILRNIEIGSRHAAVFVPLPEFIRVVETDFGSPIRVANLEELFRTKCLVTARRSKTRDWLDLYLLLRDHGFTLLDYRDAFFLAGLSDQYESGLHRLCLGQPQRDDEGYEHLLPRPPALSEMREFFQQQRDWLEQKLVITCNDTRYIVGARPWHEMRPQLLVVQKTGSSWSGWLAVGPNPNK